MPKFYQLPAQQSVLPPWVQAMTKGAVGPGDLASPMEAPVTVAAQAPALMRKMGEALLERLKARGDIPEDLFKALGDMQRRWPRLFGHFDDVKAGPIPPRKPGGLPPIGLASSREGPLTAANYKNKKYSTLYIDPERARATDPQAGVPFTLGHEATHAAQAIMDPLEMGPKYTAQHASNLPFHADPQDAYNAITYEQNANIGGARFGAEHVVGQAHYPGHPYPSKAVVAAKGRFKLMSPSPHPSMDDVRSNFRNALLKQLLDKFGGG